MKWEETEIKQRMVCEGERERAVGLHGRLTSLIPVQDRCVDLDLCTYKMANY